jgi:hypothetical protein
LWTPCPVLSGRRLTSSSAEPFQATESLGHFSKHLPPLPNPVGFFCTCSLSRHLGRSGSRGSRAPVQPRASRTCAHTVLSRRQPPVTEPPKIILYYRLSLSTWPLSNNKELLSRFRWVKPGESLTTGSRYALSPHEGGTRVQHYITLHKSPQVHKYLILQTRFFIRKSKGDQSSNNGNKTSGRYTWEAIHTVSLINIVLPLKLPTIWNRARPDGVT